MKNDIGNSMLNSAEKYLTDLEILLEQANTQLKTIHELYSQVAHLVDKDELLHAIASNGKQIVGSESCIIYEKKKGNSCFVISAAEPVSPAWPECIELPDITAQELVVWDSAKVINHWEKVDESLDVFRHHFANKGSIIIAPVVFEGTLIGMLLFIGRNKEIKTELFTGEFGSVEKRSAELVANVAISAFRAYKLNTMNFDHMSTQKDMEAAAQIQAILLPDSPPKMHSFEIAYRHKGAKEVAGDFVDFRQTGKETIAVIGDIMGHGARAGMFITLLYHLVRESIDTGNISPSEIIKFANDKLYDMLSDTDMLLSVLVLSMNEDGDITYCSAGHPEPILIRNGETLYMPPYTAPVMGAMKDIEPYCRDVSLKLSNNDIILLYTDGLIEAPSSKGILFGKERLVHTLLDRKEDSAENIADKVMKDVIEWNDVGIMSDDKSLIVIKRI